MNIKEIKEKFLNSQILHNSKYWEKIYEIMGKGLSYKQYKYHFINEDFNIPKCIYSGENCYFIEHLMKYSDVSSKYYEYIKHDSSVKTIWLTYRYLFDLGFKIEDFTNDFKNKLKKIRLFFTGTKFERNEIINFLIKDNFTDEKAKELYSYLEIKDRKLFNDFIEEIFIIKSYKNHDIEYWTTRGHSIENSKLKLEEFFKAGSASVQEKRKKSIKYDFYYKETRKPGALKSHIINGNTKESEKEKLIRIELKKIYKLNSFYTPVINEELSQIFKKRNFIHDFYINDKFIIEYNGGYWHKDYLNFNQFSKEDYMFEIKKAHNCINEIKRKNTPNYIIIWENDFNTIEEIIEFIDSIILLNEDSQFYSSREIDYELYNEYKKNFLKKQKEIKKFSDIVLRMAEDSHCESIKVAAIAVKNGRIIATGINGSPPGLLNCDTHFRSVHAAKNIELFYKDWIKTEEWRELHHEWSERNETHAEQSLICEAARDGISLDGCDIYVTHQPCMHCSKMLTAIGVKNIYYKYKYDKANSYSKYLINSSGIVMHHINKEI